MASEAILEDIDESFLQCAICRCQLKDPKSLPCLHHYCRDCLAGSVTEEVRVIECPTCHEIYPLPQNGVDGFKTDFTTRNIIEYFQLKSSVKEEPVRECMACKKKLDASAYCFMCSDFLCQICHEFHQTDTIVEDHQPHIFPVAEMEARNPTMEELVSLKGAPRCGTHPEKVSDLCCTTCGNQLICVPCNYGAHQGHDMGEVTSLAQLEREKLTAKTADLMRCEEKIYKMQEEVKKSKKDLFRNVTRKRKELYEEFTIKEKEIKTEIKSEDEALERKKHQLEDIVRGRMSVQKQQLAREVTQAQDRYEIFYEGLDGVILRGMRDRAEYKYHRFCAEEKESIEAEVNELLLEDKRDRAESHQRLEVLNKGLEDSLASLQAQQETNSKKIGEFSDHFDNTLKRLEVVTATASSIVAARHDWTDVQCVADVCTAQDALIEDMKKDYPALGALSEVSGGGLSLAIPHGGVRVKISEKEESVLAIEGMGIANRGWTIRDITGGKDGSIVITGLALKPNSHITVINLRGEKVKQVIMDGSIHVDGKRHCDFISQSKVAIVCDFREIGIYDISDGSYRKAEMRRDPSCVAVDHNNGRIVVGCEHNKCVYVCDYDLRWIKTIHFPEGVKWARDIAVYEDSLLVCNEKAVWAVNMERGSACEPKYQLPKPDVGALHYSPWSVCTDQHGYIYVLWRTSISREPRSILAHYSQGGLHILQSKLVDFRDEVHCVTTVETDQGAKLLLIAGYKGKLITYG